MMISRMRAGLATRVMRQIMNKEYLSAKAELCSNLAVEQIANGNEEEGVKNLKRMIRALNEIHLLDIEEGGRK
jgi:diphthamide synthase (EF-2-diphthine--ammonia ligase)